MVTKANRVIGVIKRIFDNNEKAIISRFYCSLVRPHLECANFVWAPRLRKDIYTIENVQSRTNTLIPELSELSSVYCSCLSSLQLYYMVYRRECVDLIHVFKMIHGKEKVKDDMLVLTDSGRSPGAQLRLAKQSCRKNTRLNFFACRVINDWISLPNQ